MTPAFNKQLTIPYERWWSDTTIRYHLLLRELFYQDIRSEILQFTCILATSTFPPATIIIQEPLQREHNEIFALSIAFGSFSILTIAYF